MDQWQQTSRPSRPRATALTRAWRLALLVVAVSVWAAQPAALAQPGAADRYVAVSGDDTLNDCLNPAAPCRTIAHAVDQADPGDTVRVAEGTYLENLTIYRPLILEGGYEAATWTRDIDLYETIIDGSASQSLPGDWDGDTVHAPSVLVDGSDYRMWFSGAEWFNGEHIGVADGIDPLTWIKHGDNPVIDGTEADVLWVAGAGEYHMWVSRDSMIFRAVSADGLAWAFDPPGPVFEPTREEGTWDRDLVGDPSIVDVGGTYYMLYEGANWNDQRVQIGLATSADGGVTWSRAQSDPVLGPTDPGNWDGFWVLDPLITHDGAQFHAWFAGYGDDGVRAIGVADSADALSWARLPDPVLTHTPETWDFGPGVGNHFVRDTGAGYEMWYSSNGQIGYATAPNATDWTKHPDPVLWPGQGTQWGLHPVFFEPDADGSVLDGFSVTGGDACGRGGGGGVAIHHGHVTVQYSYLHHNNAAGPCGGGGLEVFGPDAFVTVLYTTISHNSAMDGGGVDVWESAGAYIGGSVIEFNTARGGVGGGVEVAQSGTLSIEDSVIAGNEARSNGGGVAVVDEATATVRRTTIEGNVSHEQGGGLWHRNTAVVEDSVIVGNSADYIGGGVTSCCPDWGGDLTMVNTIVAHNHAPDGGGIAPWWRGSLTNVTVADNTCDRPDGCVGGVDAATSDGGDFHTVVNCVLYGNAHGDLGADEAFISVTYSDVGYGGWPGEGNVSAEPWFTNPAAADYHLLAWSPAIDSGTAAGAPDHDYEGDARPQNAGYDMGADEFVGTPIPNVGDRYVAPTGSDEDGRWPNLCLDSAEPCLTVQHGVNMAQTDESVRVAAGTYVENIDVDHTVHLVGGYEAAGWTRDPDLYETVLDGSADQYFYGDWDGSGVRYPFVLQTGATLRMWFNAVDLFGISRIGYATAPVGNPTNWTRHPTWVLDAGPGDAWDATGIEAPAVVRTGPSSWQMWYSGCAHDGPCAIGYATSSDGVNWTKYAGNPVLQPGSDWWNDGHVIHPAVVLADGVYTMWLYTFSNGDGAPYFARATSTDGITWTWHPANPLFGRDWEEWLWRPMVRHEGGLYRMWYSVWWEGQAHVAYAESADGAAWTKLDGPVLSPTPGGWDDGFAADPFVMPGGGYGAYAMWYDNNAAIGVTVSADGFTWSDPVGASLVNPGAPGNPGDHVVHFMPTAHGASLDGFTVTNGRECGRGGAGVFAESGVVIADAWIHGNVAEPPCGGGGIETSGPDVYLLLIDSVVENNAAANGGGVNVFDQSSLEMVNSVVAGNTALLGSGGGVDVQAGGRLLALDSTIDGNVAAGPGGGVSVGDGSAEFEAVTLVGNLTEGSSGGGVALFSADFAMRRSVVLANETLAGPGGGIAVDNSLSFYLENSVIAGNRAAADGGGLWLAGGAPFAIANSDIAGNRTPGLGAALATTGGAVVDAVNTLIAGNRGVTGIDDRDGSGSVVSLYFCDTFYNSPDGAAGLTVRRVRCLGSPPAQGVNPRPAGGTPPAGAGVAFAAQWLAYDFHLLPTSPLIDAGTGAYAPPVDIDGDARPQGAGFDIGADEVPATPRSRAR